MQLITAEKLKFLFRKVYLGVPVPASSQKIEKKIEKLQKIELQNRRVLDKNGGGGFKIYKILM